MQRTALYCASLGMLLCGCGDGVFEPNLDDFETDLRDPAALVQAYAKAHQLRDFAAYSALLDEEFEFVPLARDAEDMPWLKGGSWGREEELGITANMFDPNFNGQESPIDVIECMTAPIGEPVAGGSEILLQCQLQGQVLTSENEGWRSDTRIDMTLIWRGDYLRIRRVAELDPLRSAVPEGLGAATWGTIKSLYRMPPDFGEPAAVIEAFAAAVRSRDSASLKALFCGEIPDPSAWEFHGATLQELSILEIKDSSDGNRQVSCLAEWKLGPGEGWSAESRLGFVLSWKDVSWCIEDVFPLPALL